MRADHSPDGLPNHATDEYVRLRREITMLQARAAKVLATIDRGRLFEDVGYLTTVAFIRDRIGDSARAARDPPGAHRP